jgi:hypothetical protein
MKLFCLVVIFSAFLFSCGVSSIKAQATATGAVVTNKQTNSDNKKNTLDLSGIDFKNFTYPVPNIVNLEKSFTLNNGKAGKKDGSPSFKLRKTYFFDLTGDKKDEAITHIIASGCQLGCESSSLFYIHTAENNQPKLIWKIAIGGDVMGGLRAASFKMNEIVLETFGDCLLDDWLIKPNIDLTKNPKLKTTSYTRFTFSQSGSGYAQTSKVVLPLSASTNISDYRPQISFGEQ